MKTRPLSTPLRAACLTHPGQVREQNEDHCSISLERQLFIVSDGMGGYNAGEVASEAVTLLLPRFIEQHARQVHTWSSAAREQTLREAILQLSRQLLTESTKRSGL